MSISYEEKVRAYHAALRTFYYPKFYRNEPFDISLLENLPNFEAGQ
jgi:ABC-2 type transport system permease protein